MSNFSRALRFLGAMMLVAATAACDEDPTGATLGTASFIQPSQSVFNTTAGTAFSLSATLRDAQLNQLGTKIDATTSNTTLVRLDSAVFVPELNETRYFLRAGAATRVDSASLTLSASGLSKVVKIVVAPGA